MKILQLAKKANVNQAQDIPRASSTVTSLVDYDGSETSSVSTLHNTSAQVVCHGGQDLPYQDLTGGTVIVPLEDVPTVPASLVDQTIQNDMTETVSLGHKKDSEKLSSTILFSNERKQDDRNEYYFSDETNEPFSSDDSVADRTYLPSTSSDDSAVSEDEVDFSFTTSNTNAGEFDCEEENEIDEIWKDIQEITAEYKFQGQSTSVINVDYTEIKEPIDAYNLFVSDEIIRMIYFETNRYAAQSQKNQVNNNSWTDTDTEELRDFFAIVIAMGLVPLPALHLYWSKDEIFANKFVSSIMPRDRFMTILKYLHFADNTFLSGSNRLYKIQPLINMLSSRFRDVLMPGKEIVIDESMIPFRGRLVFRQCIPNKTHKYGVKIYKLCTLEGYTHNFIIYTGKGTTTHEFPHAEFIVYKLLESLDEREGRILYADNFYSTVPLVKTLYGRKMMYCGTLGSNRKGIPKSFSKKLKKCEVYGQEYHKLRVIKWMDKRPVMMITSNPLHTDKLVETGKKNRNKDTVKKPQAVLDYNNAKKGVDLSDQMSSYFTVLRKSLKWYRKVAFELLFGTSVVNAWVVYKKATNSKISVLEFRKALATSLTQRKCTKEKGPKKSVHTFVKPEGSGRKSRKKCVGCYKKLRAILSSVEADRKTRKVISFCNGCDGNPGYCLDCFNEFHKN
ncbi:piggyBac transposable element-derived protein 4 [Anoplophora glabripennis]|uniref:piggyBac transposable element-derived protein 4 n=1 Tax=Anoplophora glabripennis TaxID=217634 RepID=UPI00087510B3|nr:piggyBac transposable element-derived protein 4 [Anoplophora glabripennis]